MINIKRVALAIVVIVIIVVAGFLVMKLNKGSSEGAATGQLTEVPENKNETVTQPAQETPKTVDSTALEGITEGLSADKVVDLLGAPTEKQTVTMPKGNMIEYWYYTDSTGHNWQIGFSNDEVAIVRKF